MPLDAKSYAIRLIHEMIKLIAGKAVGRADDRLVYSPIML